MRRTGEGRRELKEAWEGRGEQGVLGRAGEDWAGQGVGEGKAGGLGEGKTGDWGGLEKGIDAQTLTGCQ